MTLETGKFKDSPYSVFDHFLITRFNIPFPYTDQSFTEESLRDRIVLFEQFCLPSVISQTNQNFKWIVMFDEQSPDFLMQRIETYKSFNNFIPVFSKQYTRRYTREVIAEHLSSGAEYLITSRMDNDDAISRNYIEIIQTHFDRQSLMAVNLLCGYRYKDHRIYADRFKSNPFISLIEKIEKPTSDGFKSVYCKMHYEIQSAVPTINLKVSPAWLMCIHDNNMANCLKGYRVPIQNLSGNFVLDEQILNHQDNPIICYCQWPVEFFRAGLGWVIRKFRKLCHWK